MAWTHIVDCEEVVQHLDDPDWVVFDCRHNLMDANAGPHEYGKGHIPGAYHAHIDRDLAGPVGNGSKGRHPMPFPGAFIRFLRTHGVTNATQVVCYDDAGGMWASRLWWLLRDYGHQQVALLDGGITRWKALKLPLATDHKRPREGTFEGAPGNMPTRQADAVAASKTIVDARAPERFRGEAEPIDPQAGHIPGACNLPFAGNLAADGRFLSEDKLRERYQALGDAGDVVMYCGSGVTSAMNVLAMERAGLGTPALYPGSWSEWSQPAAGRPVATGD